MERQAPRFLARQNFPLLLEQLVEHGYRLHGPQVRDGAIVYDTFHSVDQLPRGVQDQQQVGSYRLITSSNKRLFHWANGPQALKPLLQPARALALQDQHFLQGEYEDPGYRARREGLFLVAVDCSYAADTCFCASTGDGPSAQTGFDLVLTELETGYLIAAGSDKGLSILPHLPLLDAQPQDLDIAQQQHADVVAMQSRALQPIPIGGLDRQRGLPQWQDIADRCLGCGNCTMVCPTCFCHHQKDELAIKGDESQHVREWDSCFGESHGELTGFQVRKTIKHRYQQWMIHKLDSWQEQYGRSGCTGCGRCMSWCPADIDFVKEANVLGGESE